MENQTPGPSPGRSGGPPEAEVSVLRAIFRNSLDAIVTMDQAGSITGWNPRAEVMFGWSAAEVVGRQLSETIVPPRYREAHTRGLARYLFSGEGPVLGKVLDHLTALHRDGSELAVELAISPAWQQDNQNVIFVAFIRDIRRLKRDERLRAARSAVTSALASSSSWGEAAPQLIERLCEALDWDLATLFEVDEGNGIARFEASWHRPDVAAEAFLSASRALEFARGIGLPGRVWQSAAPAGIEALGDDPNFLRAPAALTSGLHSGAAFPIVAGGTVLGIIELFSTHHQSMDEGSLEILAEVGSQIGQFRQLRPGGEAV